MFYYQVVKTIENYLCQNLIGYVGFSLLARAGGAIGISGHPKIHAPPSPSIYKTLISTWFTDIKYKICGVNEIKNTLLKYYIQIPFVLKRERDIIDASVQNIDRV